MNDYYEPDYEPDFSDYEDEMPERCYDADDMPIQPIIPESLVIKVTNQLESYGLVVPEKTPSLIEGLCKGFNQCIHDNNSDGDATTYVFSPKTGSAKSVTAKMYISLLERESSIVVVPRVADALTFCEDINSWSDDNGYARCYYSVSEINPDNPLRVAKSRLQNYRCIVLTHSMFIQENKNNEDGLFQSYDNRRRDLVIVDERLSLYDRYVLDRQHIDDLISIFQRVETINRISLANEINGLQSLVNMYDRLNDYVNREKKTALLVGNSIQRDLRLTIPTYDFSRIRILVDNNEIRMSHTNTLGIQTAIGDISFKKAIIEKLSIIEYILSHPFTFHKQGTEQLLMATENILSKFGSAVVLDATAEVNEIYNTQAWYQSSSFKHIIVENPRTYSNFTIHEAKGYPQGASSIYKELNSNDRRLKASEYLFLAASLLTEENDKLLVVGHKEFVIMMEAVNINENIVFTNWGNHVGKNLWSDCNKVLIVGWWYLPESEYYGNYINAVGDFEMASYALQANTKNLYKVSQLADDLIQAVMRGSARKTVSRDGNCAISNAYIFYPDSEEGCAVMDMFKREFEGAGIVNWTPQLGNTRRRVLGSTQNLESILAFLQHRSSSGATDVSQSEIVSGTGLSTRAVSVAINCQACIDAFLRLGYVKAPRRNGQPTIIHLSGYDRYTSPI